METRSMAKERRDAEQAEREAAIARAEAEAFVRMAKEREQCEVEREIAALTRSDRRIQNDERNAEIKRLRERLTLNCSLEEKFPRGWAAKLKITRQEIGLAFVLALPKRHVYPPLVASEEPLSNTATDTEESDEEEDDPLKRFTIQLAICPKMGKEASVAYLDGSCDDPKVYLENNIKIDLEEALQKMVNLKIKPKNPIEWLGYCLLNKSVIKEQNQETPASKQPKPTGAQLNFKIELAVRAYEHERIESGPLLPNFVRNNQRKRHRQE